LGTRCRRAPIFFISLKLMYCHFMMRLYNKVKLKQYFFSGIIRRLVR